MRISGGIKTKKPRFEKSSPYDEGSLFPQKALAITIVSFKTRRSVQEL